MREQVQPDGNQPPQDNDGNARGVFIGFVVKVLTGIRDFFVASWTYLINSRATFSSLGYDLIAGAQTDLINLKGKLEQLWVIQDEDKATTALYLAAVFGKFGFTFIIIGVSLIASLLKLTAGACCLFLAGRWFTLASKVFNIFRETFVQGLMLLQRGLRKFSTNALELCSKIAQKFNAYASKFLNATLDVFRALTSYLSGAWKIILDFVAAATRSFVRGIKWIGNVLLSAWKIILDFIAAATRNFVRVIKWIGNGLLSIWRFTLDFAAAARRAIWKCIKNVGRAIIHCLDGVGHLGLGFIRAVSIVAKGVGLGIAALFIETGLASSLSGVAKTMFILDESLAAGIGALMDGVYAGGNSFINAFKSILGYGGTTPDTIPVQAAANIIVSVASVETEADELEASDDAVIAPVLDGSKYFSRKFRDNMHYVNECISSSGNELLSSYQEQRNRMIGASGWSCVEDSEATGLASIHRPVSINM